MNEPGSLPGHDIQRLVLHEAPCGWVQHVIVSFPEQAGGRHFLRCALQDYPLTPADRPRQDGDLHVGLGFSFRGLERLHLPAPVLGELYARAPAFAAGAALRAAEHLGDTGASAAWRWDPCFALDEAHAVFSLHAATEEALLPVAARLCRLAKAYRVKSHPLRGRHIGAPQGEQGQWVHFGFRDALTRVVVRGWHTPRDSLPVSQHAAGEFLLGHVNDHGFNPWLLPNAHADVRRFFHNGSFGVLRQMEQDVVGFDDWVRERADWLRDRFEVSTEAVGGGGAPTSIGAPQPPSWTDYVKAKVCGRWPDGSRFSRKTGWSAPGGAAPETDFDYSEDREGLGCPFGAHTRRMNPRLARPDAQARRFAGDQAQEEHGDAQQDRHPDARPHSRAPEGVAHARHRPLIRRGRPYGPMWHPDQGADGVPRGLLGLFFCASLEDQFEHLLGQWAERPPLGVNDIGDAKDPLIGHHENPSSRFHIPLPGGRSVDLLGLRAFVRTRGTLYAFHPSLSALSLMLDNPKFYDLPEAPLQP